MRFFQSLLPFFFPPPVARPSQPDGDSELTPAAAALLRAVGCAALAARVTVRWSRRLTSTAGLARPVSAQIVLNPRLQAMPGEVDRVLRHELAHLVAAARSNGRRIAAHGPEWKRACADLGIPGESRCHTLPLPRRQAARPHLYRCPRCAHVLRRARLIKPGRKLACLDCCKRFAQGRFDHRFAFVKIRSPKPAGIPL